MATSDTTISVTNSSIREYVRLLRPQEWIKNGFVFVGVLFANAWRQPDMLERATATAVAFCLVSSGVYILNDLLDREQDRTHPRKRLRPMAAGTISATTATALLVLLWLIGFGTATWVSVRVALILLTYVLINIAYSSGLKHIVVLDVFAIASGFMLRILAGTLGINIPPSQWLVLCGLMMALFLGFSKRRAELYASGEDMSHRRVLENYHPVFLDKMIVLTAACVILTYSLYTMSPVTIQAHKTESLIYTVPFVMYGIFRYIYSLHNQSGGIEPSREILRDPHVLLSIVGWLVATLWIIART
jgi:4-hydroxybenzoate polyprenyltransferase